MLEAFQAAALSVDKEINAVCDFILEARDWALQLETVPETERGALYGLPFSVKVRSGEGGETERELAGVFQRVRLRLHHGPGPAHRPTCHQGQQLRVRHEGAPGGAFLSDQHPTDGMKLGETRSYRHNPRWSRGAAVTRCTGTLSTLTTTPGPREVPLVARPLSLLEEDQCWDSGRTLEAV